jgi:hypothetical protein
VKDALELLVIRPVLLQLSDIGERSRGLILTLPERKLQNYPCPVCKALISGVIVKEEDILESKRSPAIVPAKCPKKHDVALYVDKQFRVRDAEPLIDPKTEGSLDKARKWIADL